MAYSQITLAQATENEAAKRAIAEAKRLDLAAADAARGNLVRAGGAGQQVDSADLLAADEKARAAKAEYDLAHAVHKSALDEFHRAQIDDWHAKSTKLRATIDGVGASLVAAAGDVDKAIDALNAAIEARNALAAEYNEAQRAAVRFNRDRDVRERSNPLMAALDSGIERPTVTGITFRFDGGFQALIVPPLSPPGLKNVALSDAATVGVKTIPTQK
jgi:hypothetical protein